MPSPVRGPERVLIYSHDTFGLGHLRRARAIANALVADRPGRAVLILSGSPLVGSFEFGPGVDLVRLPGVTKLPEGDYRSLNLALPLDDAVALRSAIIRQCADTFRPDLFLVDKEPTGFHGEVLPALDLLAARGCRLVIGLRDVLDDPALVAPEWARKGATAALARYDDAWIYGRPEVYRPLEGLVLPPGVAERIVYTGYLRREAPLPSGLTTHPEVTRGPYLLVTAGGGGDGEDLIGWVIAAYEARPDLMPALIVFGPFFARERRAAHLARIARHPRLSALAFDSRLELLMRGAAGVVAMGGYNTFCEILSFDRPALIVPRTRPRREQLIRARAAARLGLSRMLTDEDDCGRRDPARMAEALAALPAAPRPSGAAHPVPGLLAGLDAIVRLADRPDRRLAAE